MNRNEQGMTLPEVLLAVVITGIIGGVLTQSVIVGVRSTSQTEEVVSESLDRQLVSNWFVRDVQSAIEVGTGSACAGPAEGPEVKLNLRWTDGDVAKAASYMVDASEGRLVRRYCVNGAVVVENILANDLAVANPVLVTCDPDPDCSSPTPDAVAIQLTDEDGASFSLKASRRVTG